jgi:hypothetical protein
MLTASLSLSPQMPASSFPPVAVSILTPIQKDIFSLYTRPDADMSGKNDPPMMRDLVKRIQTFDWKDTEDRPLPDELIVAAIRAASFNFDLATDILF